jgi:hypothetical protein
MRRTLTALMVSALAGGAILLAATLTWDAWYWQHYREAQTAHSPGAAADAVVVENPYQYEQSVLRYVHLFIGCCAAASLWSLFVVAPAILVSRRIFSRTFISHLVATAIVSTLAGIAFSLMQQPTPYISPLVTFLAGGIIGLVSILSLASLLPPNTSLERTRGQ